MRDIGIYVHIPFCVKKCDYCDFISYCDKKNLIEAYIEKLKEEEEELKGQVTKLQDPDYVARYAREKYLFSKDGEIIIRIPD